MNNENPPRTETTSPELQHELKNLEFLNKEKIRLQKRYGELETEYKEKFQLVSKSELTWYESEMNQIHNKLDNMQYSISTLEKKIEVLKNTDTASSKIEEEKKFIIVEDKVKGFTVVDENQENYLWQDDHGQVLWTKNKNEVETKRKELQQKELEKRTTQVQENTMTPEDKEKLENLKAQEKENVLKVAELDKKDHADDLLLSEKEKELETLENEGQTLDERFADATSRVHAKVDVDATKALGPTDEEKLEQIRREILNTKTSGIANTIKQKQERSETVQKGRTQYTDAYTDAVKNKKGWALDKLRHWIGGKWLGGKHRNEAVLIKDDTTRLNENTYADLKAEIIQQGVEKQNQLINERVQQLRAQGKDQTFIDDYMSRAISAYRKKLLTETTAEYETTKGSLDKVWLEKKTTAERLANKAGQYIFHNPFLKHTIGNKYFRFAATTAILGGTGLSVAFIANRTARFLGGSIVGAGGTKLILEHCLKEEDTINSNLKKIEADYTYGDINEATYTKARDNIDLKINQIKRLKEGLILAAGVGGGALAGAGEHAINASSENIQTPQGGDTALKTTIDPRHAHDLDPNHKFTPEQQREIDKLMKGAVEKTPDTHTADTTESHSFNSTSKPIVDSTNPTINGGTTNEIPQDAPVAPPAPAPVQVQNDWLVHKGEGIENTFIRQIEHNPELQTILGYKEGMDLHDFAGKTAHQMALSNEYVDNLGHEVRITSAGIDKAAYELRINNGAVEIHEHFNGKEIETHTGHGTGIEKNIEDTKAEGGYETMHDKNHHPAHTAKHIEALRAEIDNSYPKPERYEMESLTPAKPYGITPESIKVGPYGIVPEPIKVGPNGPIGSQIEPIKVGPTGPITPIENNYQPRLPHTQGEPRTYGDPMYNGRYHGAEPDAGRNQYLESKKVSSIGGNSTGENLAQNSAPAGKDFFTILAEAFFGKDTPEIPQMTETPGGNLDDLSKAA